VEAKKLVRNAAIIEAVQVPLMTTSIAAKDHEELMRQVAVWVIDKGGIVVDFQNDKLVVQGPGQEKDVTVNLGYWLLYNSTGTFGVTSVWDVDLYFTEVK